MGHALLVKLFNLLVSLVVLTAQRLKLIVYPFYLGIDTLHGVIGRCSAVLVA